MTFTLTRIDKNDLPKNTDEIRVLLVGRNELTRLVWLLDHYRRIGVDRFLVVDNGSDDGSVDYLLTQPDVHLWTTPDSYAASEFGRYWLDQIRVDHGAGHWCIVVDADEVLVFPFCEQLTIRDLVDYMKDGGYRGLFTFMLDMYPAGALRDAKLSPGQSFLDLADHFDAGPYFVTLAEERFPRLSINGGLRRRIFYQSGMMGRGPNLRKVPLIFWQDGDSYRSAHSCSEMPMADITGVLLHFKYFSDFHDKARIEAERKEHKSQGGEYASYLELLAQIPDVSFLSEFSRRYVSSSELVKLQLMICSRPFIEFARTRIHEKYGADAKEEELNDIKTLLRKWDDELRLPIGVLSKLWQMSEIR